MTTPLDEIKQLYYNATRTTIEQDFDRALDILKTMHTEEERERATVYMQGLAEMRSQWQKRAGFGVRRAKSEVRRAESGVRGAESPKKR